MSNIQNARWHGKAIGGILLAGLLLVGATKGIGRDRVKSETIDATAMGTSTQLGQMISVTLNINEFSAPQDKAILMQAFEKGQNQGLVNALSRMKAVGHVEITGTLGYDCAYIHMVPTPTGRKIVFLTNRQIKFGEAFFDTQSQSFNVTAGELNLNDQEKHKSSGVVYPAAQLTISKDGQLQFELNQNAWKLENVIDWKGNPEIN